MLYVENLRLRASEIALASQLKREREQSKKIVADAEAAVTSLLLFGPSAIPMVIFFVTVANPHKSLELSSRIVAHEK